MRVKNPLVWFFIFILIIAFVVYFPQTAKSLYGEENIYIKSIELITNNTYFDEPAYKFTIGIDRNTEFSKELPYNFPHKIRASGSSNTTCTYNLTLDRTIYFWDICNGSRNIDCSNYTPCVRIGSTTHCINISRCSNQGTPPGCPLSRVVCSPTNKIAGYIYNITSNSEYSINFNLKISNLILPVSILSPTKEKYLGFTGYVKYTEDPCKIQYYVYKNSAGEYFIISNETRSQLISTQTAPQIQGIQYAQQYNATIQNPTPLTETNCYIHQGNLLCDISKFPNTNLEIYIRKSAIGEPQVEGNYTNYTYQCGDTICETYKGENATNCPIDCLRNQTEPPSEEEAPPLEEKRVSLPFLGEVPETTALLIGIGLGLGILAILPQALKILKIKV